MELFEKNWGQKKNFKILKRFFKIYLAGFSGAVDLRTQFMQVNHYLEVRSIAENIKSLVNAKG